ncbi:hypothetical protein [Halothiobacillus sp. 15-55-196]|jgi:protein-tyrosine-phosphatase|uniref:hypothetical protein n=1 Tax=Halothiobacillus sp. 15-55-196 TaxID=1970382 RepID=UPI0025C675AF|nr:hypothetical protein [Halothiobacillus sp. 15-55-196]
MKQTLQIPETNIDEFVINLAREHGIEYTPTRADAIAEVITRLSGDEVVQDDINDLILALSRANVIDEDEFVTLIGHHSREKHHVRSVR